jgi:hypothetical protein
MFFHRCVVLPFVFLLFVIRRFVFRCFDFRRFVIRRFVAQSLPNPEEDSAANMCTYIKITNQDLFYQCLKSLLYCSSNSASNR